MASEHPQGRKGIGVAQPQGGIDFPFIAVPSDDIRYLLADFYLEHGKTSSPPYRLKWLYGVGTIATSPPVGLPVPTHDVDLVIVDANDQVVFDSTLAVFDETSAPHSGYYDHAWGGRMHLYEWKTEIAVARLVVHTHWSPEKDLEPRDYRNHITPTGSTLDPRTVVQRPGRVDAISILLDQLRQTSLALVGGYNVRITASDASTTQGGRRGQQLVFDAVPGLGDGVFPGCEPEPIIFKTINEIAPSSSGDFYLQAKDCFFVRRPTELVQVLPRRTLPTTDLAPYSAPDTGLPHALAGISTEATGWPQSKEYGHLQFGNDCGPCCSCEDYLNLADYLNETQATYQELGTDADVARVSYHSNRLQFVESQECRLRRPLRVALQPQICPYMDIGIQFCNHTTDCLQTVVLSCTISGGIGTVVPGYTFVSGVTREWSDGTIERGAMGGSHPTWTYTFDSVGPHSQVSAKFRLEFPECDTALAITATLVGTIAGSSITIIDADTGQPVTATAQATRSLDCPAGEGATKDLTKCDPCD